MKIIESKGYNIIVDDDVYEWASRRTWTIEKRRHTNYAKCKDRGVMRRIHRMIMGVTDPSILIDHINGNGLDNRRENLRTCTPLINSRNKHNKNSRWGAGTSKYFGVYFKRNRNKYEAHIKHNGKMIYIGIYESEIDAAMAYNEVAIRLRGNETHLNHI